MSHREDAPLCSICSVVTYFQSMKYFGSFWVCPRSREKWHELVEGKQRLADDPCQPESYRAELRREIDQLMHTHLLPKG